ncbi:uncharacterized protein LOC115451041 isoform X1 [Manduca sexta]|nr:uncharacterized protein LOC115451041 isoform X1 [Manduca sexta]
MLVKISCRKYDLEAEAVKLYGEDFDTVLKRFRKTPDYLMILNDKVTSFCPLTHMKELNENQKDMGMQTLYYYIEKLNSKVEEMLGLDKEREMSTTSSKPQSFFRDHFARRQQESPDSQNGVQKLDSYPALSAALSVAERNSYMDLGFQYAGHIIHTIIKSMGPDDESPVKSTRLPYGGDHRHDFTITTTTEHVHVHEVTPSVTDVASTVAPDPSPAQGFKYRYKAQRS